MKSSDRADTGKNKTETQAKLHAADSLLSNAPVYSILAVYMPLSALTAYIFLLEALLSINLNAVLLLAGAAISAAAASFYHDFMKDIKASRIAANIRGAVIITALIYLFASLLNTQTSWREKFIPNFFNIPSSACAVYSWISVITLKQLFFARKQFEIITEMYEGQQLKEKLFEDSGLLQYTDEKINKARRSYFVQLGIIAVLVLSGIIMKIKFSLPLYLLLIVILTGGTCIYGLFKIISWEQYYAGEGINLSGHDRVKRILAVLVLTFSGIAFAWLVSSDNSVIPISVILAFFAWLFSLFRRTTPQTEQPPPEIGQFTGEGISPGLMPYEDSAWNPFWEQILKYGLIILKFSLVILVIFLFIKFMISPLLNRSGILGRIPFFRRLVLIIKQWCEGVLEAILSFFNYRNRNSQKTRGKYGDEEINRAAKNILSAYSAAKKRDVQKSVNLFARLIIWGTEVRRADWKPSYAPGEYCGILAERKPLDGAALRLNSGILRCGDLFEKALYSAYVLSNEEQNEFKNLVDEITSFSE